MKYKYTHKGWYFPNQSGSSGNHWFIWLHFSSLCTEVVTWMLSGFLAHFLFALLVLSLRRWVCAFSIYRSKSRLMFTNSARSNGSHFKHTSKCTYAHIFRSLSSSFTVRLQSLLLSLIASEKSVPGAPRCMSAVQMAHRPHFGPTKVSSFRSWSLNSWKIDIFFPITCLHAMPAMSDFLLI